MAKKSPIADDPSADAIPTASRGDQIAHEMACAGFTRVKDAISKNYVEWRKIYTDTSGTTGLVTALVRKDDAGIEPNVLEGFVLTVQKHIRAIPEDIHNGSWKFAKDDLLHLIEVLGAADEAVAVNEHHIVMTKCDECGVNSTEFMSIGKKKLCRDCFDKVGL